MEIIRDLDALARHPYPVTAIGNFDGVHLGHRAILKAAIDRARAAGGTAFALTFDPLPAKLLVPARAPKLILTPDDKLELLRMSGIDGVIVINFTLELSMLPPRDFVRDYLRGKIGVREVVVGHSVSFGHNRAGNAAVMVELGREFGFDTDVVGPVKVDGIEVSSTKVREAITARRHASRGEAAGPLSLSERPGRARTRARPHDRISDRESRQRNRMHPARRRLRDARDPRRRRVPDRSPTSGCARRSPRARARSRRTSSTSTATSTGKRIKLELIERIRPERKFDNADALKAQIAEDLKKAREILAAA